LADLLYRAGYESHWKHSVQDKSYAKAGNRRISSIIIMVIAMAII